MIAKVVAKTPDELKVGDYIYYESKLNEIGSRTRQQIVTLTPPYTHKDGYQITTWEIAINKTHQVRGYHYWEGLTRKYVPPETRNEFFRIAPWDVVLVLEADD